MLGIVKGVLKFSDKESCEARRWAEPTLQRCSEPQLYDTDLQPPNDTRLIELQYESSARDEIFSILSEGAEHSSRADG
jgi:hypothetical protein